MADGGYPLFQFVDDGPGEEPQVLGIFSYEGY